MKIYSKFYTHLSASFPNATPGTINGPFTVPTGKMVCVAVPFPPEGYFTRLVVVQVPSGSGGGTAVPCQVELLNSAVPYPQAGNPYTSNASPADNLEHYRVQTPITAPLSADAGAVLTYTTDELGVGYRNIDGSDAVMQQFLYLLLNPQGAGGSTKWNVTLQARRNLG